MIARATLRDAVVTALGALTLTGTPAVVAWSGDPQEFNPGAVFPRVLVRLERVAPGENQSIGGMAYVRDTALAVYVTSDSDAEALTLLDEIETGLPGDLGSTGRRIFFAEETAEQAPELGLVLYRQTYTVRDQR